MDELKKVELPSGAKLEISPAPWQTAKALYKAIAAEVIPLKIDPKAEVDVNIFKDLLLTALASDKIEEQLWECMGRCTYKGLKITKDTFEPMEARGDYLAICFEVAVVNVSPFTKSLYAKYGPMFREIIKFRA